MALYKFCIVLYKRRGMFHTIYKVILLIHADLPHNGHAVCMQGTVHISLLLLLLLLLLRYEWQRLR